MAPHDSNQKQHVHQFVKTNKWGMWITDPRRPAGQRRLYCGAYDSKYLALRAQDRANLKFNPDMRNSGGLNFKASDYNLDQELRETLSRKNFRKFLMGESRSCYNKWEPSPCWKKFLDEERVENNLPKGLGKKTVKSLAIALQELKHSSRNGAAALKAKVARVATVQPQSRQGRISDLNKPSVTCQHTHSRSTPTANRISATPLKDLQPTGMRQARKMLQPIALPVRQAPLVLQPATLPVRQTPMVVRPTKLPIRQAPTVQQPSELAIQQVQPPARECQSETYPAEQSHLTPLDWIEWKNTGKRSLGTKRIMQPIEAAPAPKLCEKKKLSLDLTREPDASSTGSCDGCSLSDEVEESATTLILLKARLRTA